MTDRNQMTDRKPPFATVEEALEEIRQGRQIVLNRPPYTSPVN